MTFNYIVPDMLISGGALPLQFAMEALAKGFFDFYSSAGWKSFVFSIFPICALLGLIGLSHKLSTGEETWGKGCSNFIFKVMIATAILVVAPNSPKYLTELINQTSAVLRISNNIENSEDLIYNPYVSSEILAIMQKNQNHLGLLKEYMSSTINYYSKRTPNIYGENVTFDSVTGLSDINSGGTGFPNVNFHDPTNDAGNVISSNLMQSSTSEIHPLDGSEVYEINVAPLSQAMSESLSRTHDKINVTLDNEEESDAISKIKVEVLPLLTQELSEIRRAFIADYIKYITLEKTVAYYKKIDELDENNSNYTGKRQDIIGKLNANYSKVSQGLYEDLVELEEESRDKNKLVEIPGILFNFSMIFVSIYVTFNLYILPIVLPLWAAMSMLPDSSQLSQSLKKGLTIVITTWLLPVFLDLIIMIGNSFYRIGDYIAEERYGSMSVYESYKNGGYVGGALKLVFPDNPNLEMHWDSLGFTTLIPLMGGFVAMMLIIAAPLIVNKLISGSSGFIDTVTSSVQKGAGLASTGVIGGASAGAAIASPIIAAKAPGMISNVKNSFSNFGSSGSSRNFNNVGSNMGNNSSDSGPMDSA